MSLEEFTDEVFKALQKPEYSAGKPTDYLKEAMEEYADLIEGGYEDATSDDSYGFEWHANNTAMNISMCI